MIVLKMMSYNWDKQVLCLNGLGERNNGRIELSKQL